MKVSDPNKNDTVRVKWNYAIPKAVFSKKMVGKYEEWSVCWQTTLADASFNPYFFAVTAFDDGDTSLQSTRNYSIIVKPIIQSYDRVYTVGKSGEVTMEVTNEKYLKISNWVPNYHWTIDFNWWKKIAGKSVRYKFDTPGQHIIKVSGEFGNCLTEYYDTVNIITAYPTGIGQATENVFSIYPNPGSGNLILIPNSSNTDKSQVMLTDLLGKIVLPEQTYTSQNNSSITVQTSQLPPGIYLVRVSANGAVQTFKWVKQ